MLAQINKPLPQKQVGVLPIGDLEDVMIPLGGSKLFPILNNEDELWSYIAINGLTKAHFNALLSYSGMSQRALSAIVGISAKTVQTKQLSDPFDINVSEKLVYLAALFNVAKLYYNDLLNFVAWLYIPNSQTDNRNPVDYLSTVRGIYKIIAILWGALDGIYQ